MDERILNSNLFSKMIYDEATRSDSHFNHLPVFLLPNEMGGSQTRLLKEVADPIFDGKRLMKLADWMKQPHLTRQLDQSKQQDETKQPDRTERPQGTE